MKRTQAYMRKLYREFRADPRIYEKNKRYPVKVLAAMYGIDLNKAYVWRRRARSEAA